MKTALRPDWDHLLARAAAGDQGSQDRIDRAVQAESDRRHLVARLRRVSPSSTVTVYHPDAGGEIDAAQPAVSAWSWRRATDYYDVGRARLRVVGSREVRAMWTQNPADMADRMAGCGAAWGAGVGGDGGAFGVPLGCSVPLCPSCMGRRGGSRIAAWVPILGELASAGYPAVLLTLTRPADLAGQSPVVLTDREHDSGVYRLHRRARRSGAAVPGEPLTIGLEQLGTAWRDMTNGTHATAAWWRATTAGAYLGREWTGLQVLDRDEDTGRPRLGRLRWHVHLHALVVLRPGVLDAIAWRDHGGRKVAIGGPWWERLVSAWAHYCPGAEPGGQDLRRIDDDAGAGLAEVMKYPFKPASITAAQAAEVVAAAGGMRHHQPTGLWHGSSRVALAARAYLRGEVAPADAWALGWAGADAHREPTRRACTLDELPDDDRALAEILACGIASREAAADERACVLLYREPDPWDVEPDAPPVQIPGGPQVRAVTVAWLQERARTGAPEGAASIWSYRPRSKEWVALADAPLDAILAGIVAPSGVA